MEVSQVDATDLMKDITITFKLGGVQKLRWRLWLAAKIFRFGSWVIGCKVVVEWV